MKGLHFLLPCPFYWLIAPFLGSGKYGNIECNYCLEYLKLQLQSKHLFPRKGNLKYKHFNKQILIWSGIINVVFSSIRFEDKWTQSNSMFSQLSVLHKVYRDWYRRDVLFLTLNKKMNEIRLFVESIRIRHNTHPHGKHNKSQINIYSTWYWNCSADSLQSLVRFLFAQQKLLFIWWIFVELIRKERSQ